MSQCVDHVTTFLDTHRKILPFRPHYSSKAIVLARLYPQRSNVQSKCLDSQPMHFYRLFWKNVILGICSFICLCMYIWIYIYIYICIYIHICLLLYSYLLVFISICIYILVYFHVHCIYKHTLFIIYIYIHIYTCLCICSFIYIIRYS